jgi:hypothetical protein
MGVQRWNEEIGSGHSMIDSPFIHKKTPNISAHDCTRSIPAFFLTNNSYGIGANHLKVKVKVWFLSGKKD